MGNKPLSAILILGAMSIAPTAHSQSQKIPIVSCSSDAPVQPGSECNKAYDGNNGTSWGASGVPGSYQILYLNSNSFRRVKRIVATWENLPTGFRDYFYIDGTSAYKWITSRNDGNTTDDITLNWKVDPGDRDSVVLGQTFMVWVSSAARLREISFYGPGIYNETQIVTKRIPIPAWNMVAEGTKIITISPTIPANRLVGASAFIYSDDNMVHNLTSLSIYPLEAYTYATGAGNVGFPAGFSLSASGTPGSTQIDAIYMATNQGYHQNWRFDDPAKNPRGWITLQYLSQAPEHP